MFVNTSFLLMVLKEHLTVRHSEKISIHFYDELKTRMARLLSLKHILYDLVKEFAIMNQLSRHLPQTLFKMG